MRSLISIGKHFMGSKNYDKNSQWKAEMGSLYDLKANDLDGRPFDLSALKGKVSLVCNVASECGYTKCGYTFLEEEQQKYAQRGFTVLAFPLQPVRRTGTGRTAGHTRVDSHSHTLTHTHTPSSCLSPPRSHPPFPVSSASRSSRSTRRFLCWRRRT